MKAIRTISALMLALLVLVSSTSFMVGMHFCKGEVESVSVFSKADDCRKQHENLPPCHRHKKIDCCEDKTILHEGDDFKNSLQPFQQDSPHYLEIIDPAVVISEVVPTSHHSRNISFFYDPPLPSPDITVDLHVFLI